MDLKNAANKPALRKTALWVAGIVVGIGILGFLLAPPLVKHFAQKILSDVLHRPVTIEAVSINPYAMTAAVRGFQVKEPDGSADALRFDELFVNLQAESLFRGGFVLREIRLASPYLRLVRNDDGRYNVSDLIEEFLARPKSEGETHFSLNNIRVTGGRVEFDDRPLKQRHEVSEIDVGVPFVSNLPSHVDIEVQPAFSAKVDGTALSLGGEAKPFRQTREATVDLKLDQLDLTKYVAYSPVPLPFKLPGGKLDTRLHAIFVQPPDGKPSLNVTGDVALKGFVLTDKADAPVLAVPLLAVAVDAVDVFGGKAAVRSVLIDKPELQVRRAKDGHLTLLDLIPRPAPSADAGPAPATQPPAAAKEATAPPFRFTVGEIRLSEGRIGFTDEAVAPAFATRVEPLNVLVRNLGNEAGQAASVELDLKGGNGEQITQQASVTLSPLAARGKVEITGVQPGVYLPYYAGMVLFKPVSGTLGLSTGFDVALGEGEPKVLLEDIAVRIADLRLRQDGEKDDFYRLAEARIGGGKLDLGQRTLTIGEVAVRDSAMRVRRERGGELSLTRLFPLATASVRAAQEAAAARKSSPETPWVVSIGTLAMDGHDILFEDRTPPEPARVSITGMKVRVENLGTQKGAQPRFAIEARINKRGSVKLAGSAVLEPLAAKTSIDVKGIEILPFQPYFADKVNITLTGGAVTARGNLSFEQPKEGPPKLSYRGNAGVSGLHTVDKANSADFLVWKSLFIDGIDLASVQPLKLDIREVSLSDFYARLILNADGRLNAQQVARAPDEAGKAAPPQSVTEPSPAAPKAEAAAQPAAGSQPPASATATPPDYKITVRKVSLQGGNVNFSDFFIKPNYTADMKALGGSIAGLSSDLGTTADVELRGKVSDAPLEILGKVNPLSGSLFVDLKAGVTGMELPQFSPYSGKYAGYAIEKGKLTVNVAYKVENRKLEAQNNVFLDQLTFGEKVESPDATKLPVMLAVSLLKNSRGEIDIRLPIGGSLDDPQFSVGSVIIQVLVNLIVKAVTAPFALLGSLFGGGEELAYAEFDPGRAVIAVPVEKKLETLAKALNDRPGLKLEITGAVDPQQDREGLKQAALERKVKAQKHSETVKKGEEAASVEDVSVGKDEYAKYLERAYKQEKFPKPRNAIGLAKDLPPEEMEKLMLANAEVTEDDLRQLANRRAQSVKDHLVEKGKVPQERVFLLAPKLGGEPPKDKGPATRVDFSLK